MTKRLFSILALFCCASLCVLAVQSDAFAAAKKTKTAPKEPLVLILPFQINGGPEMSAMSEEFPKLMAERLKMQGLRVVSGPMASTLMKKRNVDTLDLTEARALARAAGAQYTVYGVLNQLGEGFSLDGRLVPVSTGTPAQPLSIQKNTLLELAPAVDTIAATVAAGVSGSRPASAATAAGVGDRDVKIGGAKGGLADVTVRGMKVLDPDVVLMRLSIRKGDNPDAKAINDEVKRVWDMGYFSDVQVAIEPGNVLVFTVVEKPRIDSIIVEGSDKVSQDDILAAMGTKSGSVLNEKLLVEDLQKVTDLYRKEGYYLAKVEHRIDSRPNANGAVLVLSVNEGKKLYIKKVIVEGLKQLKEGDFEDYMALRPRTMLSWFTGTGVLKDEYLERDSNAIAAFGLNQGFVDIQVSAPKVDYREDGIYITFAVAEGERYSLGDIKFAGDLIVPEEKLLEVVQLDEHKKDQRFFSLSVMQEDTKRLTDFYGDDGYAFAEVDTKVMKDESGAPIVTVGYLIDKKNKVYIRRTSVEGNQKTRDNVILREMRLADGDQYEGAKLRRSNERLNRLRYFSAVDSELVPTGVEDEVDLKVKVKEANTGALMGGIGYSSYYDIGVTVSLMERNLFGRGYWAQLQGFFSWRRTSGMFSVTNPRVNDTDLLIGNDLYYTYDYWDDFTKETVGDTIRVAYPIGEYTSVGGGYRLERYSLYDVKEFASPSIADYAGNNWTSAIHARITRDTTDNRERPSQGTITRLWAEYGGGGLGGNDNFVKAVADWQGFYTWRPNHTFHVRGRLGGVFENTSSVVPVFERFWVGGIDTIRGYSYTDLSPRDKRYHDQIGGDRMGVANIEYVWTFQKEMGLALVPFYDIGFNIDSKTMTPVQDYLASSAGLELRWRSPMGDLRIAYGIPLTKDYDGERPAGRLEFTMGQFF